MTSIDPSTSTLDGPPSSPLSSPFSSTLFDRYRLGGGLTLPNRVVMAPMTRARAAAGGLATPSMATYYAQRATAGLIVSEGVQPSLIGQSNPGTPGLHTDEQAASWRPVTAAVHANGGRIFAQIMHGGRVSHPDTTGLVPVGPSAVPAAGEVFTPTGPQPAPTPRALETAEVPEHAQSYASAARRAVDAGFDGVELHGANGYLISQFLSSNANLRTDRYGGSAANRVRFAVDAVAATVDAVGAARTGIRLSPGGTFWGVEEREVPELYTVLLGELARLEPAYVHLEATADDEVLLALRRAWPGTLIMNPVLPLGPKRTGRSDADRWLGLGADLISFGRAFIANPDLVERLRGGLPVAPEDEAAYYQGGDAGYVTYGSYQHAG
ncbi:alkene reductase [Streptomyces sp. cmx-18-6]|uniref:alkene reductase n=1 Tax=Streptomyces sp. cmx-18-6 TaxID=2790930 RepID=UPI0039813596